MAQPVPEGAARELRGPGLRRAGRRGGERALRDVCVAGGAREGGRPFVPPPGRALGPPLALCGNPRVKRALCCPQRRSCPRGVLGNSTGAPRPGPVLPEWRVQRTVPAWAHSQPACHSARGRACTRSWAWAWVCGRGPVCRAGWKGRLWLGSLWSAPEPLHFYAALATLTLTGHGPQRPHHVTASALSGPPQAAAAGLVRLGSRGQDRARPAGAPRSPADSSRRHVGPRGKA